MLHQKMGWFGSLAVMLIVTPLVFGGEHWRSGGSEQLFGSADNDQDEFVWRGGKGGNIIFADDDFAAEFPEMAWVDATKNRNVQRMIDCAWELRKVEKVLGKKDKKTTSGAMFETAARLAVNQGDKKALKKIIALEPECKKYKQDMKAKGKTRGVNNVPHAMPEIVYPKFPVDASEQMWGKMWKRAVKALEEDQVPFLRPRMVQYYYSDISDDEASRICMLLNQGRMKNNPKMLVQAATELKGQKGSANVAFLSPKGILGEAAELAVSMGDKSGLTRVVEVYESGPFGMTSKANMYKQMKKTMGGTRGASTLGDSGVSAPELLSPDYAVELKSSESQK